MTEKKPPRPQRCCWICGTIVALETCKIDRLGLPVHEHCYAKKIAFDGAFRLTDRTLRPASA